MCWSILHACMYVYHVCAWYWRRPEEGTGSLELELDSCGLPGGLWELSLGPDGRAAGALTCWAISLVPRPCYLITVTPLLLCNPCYQSEPSLLYRTLHSSLELWDPKLAIPSEPLLAYQPPHHTHRTVEVSFVLCDSKFTGAQLTEILSRLTSFVQH